MYQATNAPAHSPISFGFAIWQRFTTAGRRATLYKQTVRALEGLSDAQLLDVGVDRSQIHAKALLEVEHHIERENAALGSTGLVGRPSGQFVSAAGASSAYGTSATWY